jgi:F-type H+-transporting ATPase subunit a
MLFLGLFFGLIQTFVFTVLSIIYLSGAVAHDH